jgi:hypothetical protein
MNQEIKINLTKISGSFVHNLKGKTGTVKSCLIIPLENSGLYMEDGKVYIKVIGQELTQKKGQTHLCKLAIDYDQYMHLTEAERNALPIIGGIKEFGVKKEK